MNRSHHTHHYRLQGRVFTLCGEAFEDLVVNASDDWEQTTCNMCRESGYWRHLQGQALARQERELARVATGGATKGAARRRGTHDW